MLQLGKEQRFTVDGKEWVLSRLTLKIVDQFREWIVSVLPDPLAMGDKYFAMLPAAEQIARVKEAEQNKIDLACFSIQSPLAQRFMATERGIAKLAQLMLQEHHPDITEAAAFDVMFSLQDQLAVILEESQGKLPAGAVGNAAASVG